MCWSAVLTRVCIVVIVLARSFLELSTRATYLVRPTEPGAARVFNLMPTTCYLCLRAAGRSAMKNLNIDPSTMSPNAQIGPKIQNTVKPYDAL